VRCRSPAFGCADVTSTNGRASAIQCEAAALRRDIRRMDGGGDVRAAADIESEVIKGTEASPWVLAYRPALCLRDGYC
jgi:hypothetical protein